MNAGRKKGPTKINKKFNKAVSFLNLNYEGDNDNNSLSEKTEKIKTEQAVEMTDKKKGKKICCDDSPPKLTPINTKRKVSFSSPKNETFHYSAQSAPTKALNIGSPMGYAKKCREAKTKRIEFLKKKKVYRVKSRDTEGETSQTNRQNEKGRDDLNELKPVVDLGHISPLLDTDFSSPERSSYTPSPTTPTESDIVKDNLANMIMSDHEERGRQKREIKRDETDDDESSFKRKLTKWLKENNLRLSAVFNSHFNSTCADVVEPVPNGPPSLNFENLTDDVIDGKEKDTMGLNVYP
ncbi:hypothetical protein E5676_scaffold1017G00010 [Cucumis melo var. makuwa]|uniref:Uncharacterized protein n=1 Tax=Cucumis melo var. makuwa TaxID=1194695 RepID=A0A5D3CJ66_CUCMM|nr:hypothetical protein E5676_scaffold1017G00010 [Cucumis melo var. makuwa]